MKFGTLLAREKVITPEQLEEALKNQVVYGGRLGTILLTLGHIDIETHKRLLSRHFGVPCASQSDLEDAPRDLIERIPSDLVQKHGVHPIKIEGQRLHLAMANPRDLMVLDEISFLTGLMVVPYAVPEIVLAYYLERNYGIPRREYHARLSELERLAIFGGRIPDRSRPGVTPARPLPESRLKAAEPPLVISAGLLPLENAIEQMDTAPDRTRIGLTILQFARQYLSTAALFLVKTDEAIGWVGVSADGPLAVIGETILPLDGPSVLKTVKESGAIYLGPVGSEPLNEALLRALGRERPATALVLPVHVRRRVVNLFYGDTGRSEIDPTLPARLSRLLAAAGTAYERLILESKKKMEL